MAIIYDAKIHDDSYRKYGAHKIYAVGKCYRGKIKHIEEDLKIQDKEWKTYPPLFIVSAKSEKHALEQVFAENPDFTSRWVQDAENESAIYCCKIANLPLLNQHNSKRALKLQLEEVEREVPIIKIVN